MHARRQRAVGQLADDAARLRALHRQHRPLVDAIDDVCVEVLGVTLEPGEVLVVIGGVGDREEVLLGEPVGEHVIEDAAVLAAQDAVLGPALRDAAHVV